MAKFSKIAKLFRGLGNKILNKFDADVCYKKMLEYHDQMDFYAFIDAIGYLLEKCFDAPPSRFNKSEFWSFKLFLTVGNRPGNRFE